MRKSNLTYEQLIELAPKDRPFQIEVEFSSGISYGKEILWAYITDGDLWTIFEEYTRGFWKDTYKGKFTLIDEYRNIYEKPEVLEVGTEVEILESGKVVKTGTIYWVYVYDADGVICPRYDIELNDSKNNFPHNDIKVFSHYCVRPVEKVEEKEEIITVNGKRYKLIEE